MLNHMVLLQKYFGTKRGLVQFVLTVAFVVYALVNILSNPDPGNVVGGRVDQLAELLENTERRSEELRRMIEDLSSYSVQLDQQSAQQLIEKLEHGLKNPTSSQKNDVMAGDGFMSGAAEEHADGSLPPKPSLEYELLRRQIRNNIAEIGNYFVDELGKMRKKVASTQPAMVREIDKVLQLGPEHKRSLLSDMERLQQVDGYETWRQQEARHLTDLVQRRLQYLQNPKDCKNALKLVCELDKDCGFACQLHNVVFCFIAAYATERTMILQSTDWRYHKSGWEQVFLPVSETCSETVNTDGWADRSVMHLPAIEMYSNRSVYMSLSIPKDLATRLQRLHGDPAIWWVGLFLKYLLRPQKDTADFLESSKSKLGWQKPIVGVHVRRTDKLRDDAAVHSIEEYMSHVEDYFLKLEINGTTLAPRRIFLATDDADVLKKTRKQYPQYEVIGDVEVAKMAAKSTRYSRTALNGIIRDIHFLAHCDYIVCTFSSHVCRVAFEIMQTLQPDAAHRFKSLDDIYYYGGQNPHQWQTVIGHKRRNNVEIDMRPYDLVGVSGNSWDRLSKGESRHTNQSGFFTPFKMDKMETVKLPLYEQGPLQM